MENRRGEACAMSRTARRAPALLPSGRRLNWRVRSADDHASGAQKHEPKGLASTSQGAGALELGGRGAGILRSLGIGHCGNFPLRQPLLVHGPSDVCQDAYPLHKVP
jgi:hypothetical protein